MKTLCVIAVVLSLASLCQSVSLACLNLIKPVEKSPNVSASWYVIAMSSSQLLFTTLGLNVSVSLSLKVTYTPTGIPNLHDAFYHFKVYKLCANESERSLVYDGSIYDVDSNNVKGKPGVILQTGCSDCMVVKSDNDLLPVLTLLSRRQTVSEAELNEFKTQAECLKLSKPVVFGTDHDYVNCKEFNTDEQL